MDANGADTPSLIPPVPPSINSRSDRDRIPTLMMKLYDIHRDEYNKVLGLEDVTPKKMLHTDKTEIDVDITKTDAITKACKDYGVSDKDIKHISVKGNGTLTTLYFMNNKDEVQATTTTTKYEHKDPEHNKDSKLERVFWTTHVQEAKKVIFGYKEGHVDKPVKANVIAVEYDPKSQVFSTKHEDKKTSTVKDLGNHPLAMVEQQNILTGGTKMYIPQR